MTTRLNCKKCGHAHTMHEPRVQEWCESCFRDWDRLEQLLYHGWEAGDVLTTAEEVIAAIQFVAIAAAGTLPRGCEDYRLGELERWLVPSLTHQLRTFVVVPGGDYRKLEVKSPVPVSLMAHVLSEATLAFGNCHWG